MSAETKLLILAAIITVGGAWFGCWIMKPPRGVIGDKVDPPAKDTNRKNDAGFWS